MLAVDENEPVAAAALRGAARLLGDERFAAATVDDASRERLRNAVDPSHRRTATGRDDAVQSDAHRDAALAAVVALLVRDAAADGKRPSKATKADAAALAARAETGDAAALDAAAAALGRQFAKCHRELVQTCIGVAPKRPGEVWIAVHFRWGDVRTGDAREHLVLHGLARGVEPHRRARPSPPSACQYACMPEPGEAAAPRPWAGTRHRPPCAAGATRCEAYPANRRPCHTGATKRPAR